MQDSEPRRIGVSIELKPHAYDPATSPELFEGVLERRVVAFIIDFLLIVVPFGAVCGLAAVFILGFGIVTLGLGWLLYPVFFSLIVPLFVIWAMIYCGLGFASPESATVGMRVMGIEMRTWYGAPAYFLLGAVHTVFFWITVCALTPFVLLVAFFNRRRRLLHDMLVGTVIINNDARAAVLRTARRPF